MYLLAQITTAQAAIHPSKAGTAEKAAPQVWMADLDLPHFLLDPPEQIESCPFLADS